MRTYKIYIIRHGITSANLEGRYAGITDNDLCEEGVANILSKKEEYEYPNVLRVYSSPLKRAVQTARLLYPDITPVTVNNLRECNFGIYENKLLSEIKDDPNFEKWMRDGGVGAPGGEDFSQLEARAIEGLNMVITDMMHEKISEAALVTHGGIMSILLAICGLPKRTATQWSVNNGMGYTLLINASLWGNNRAFEVFTPIPYGTRLEEVTMDYQRAYFSEENAPSDSLDAKDTDKTK